MLFQKPIRSIIALCPACIVGKFVCSARIRFRIFCKFTRIGLDKSRAFQDAIDMQFETFRNN